MEKTCTTVDDPETQVFKSEETGSGRLGFCVVVLFCYCCLFIFLKTAYHYISFSFQTKFSDSALRGALQFSIFLRNIIDNNIFPSALIGKSLLLLAPKETTLHQLCLCHLLQGLGLKFCKVHEMCVGVVFAAINPKQPSPSDTTGFPFPQGV